MASIEVVNGSNDEGGPASPSENATEHNSVSSSTYDNSDQTNKDQLPGLESEPVNNFVSAPIEAQTSSEIVSQNKFSSEDTTTSTEEKGSPNQPADHEALAGNSAPTPLKAKATTSPSLKPRYILEGLLLLAVIVLAIWTSILSGNTSKLKTDNSNLVNQVNRLKANPEATIQQQNQALISAVGKLTTLPKGETPTIASVSNATAAKQQSSFFNNAQNGDKVLMYVKAGEAILYRPSTNKVILVAPLTLTGSSTSTAK